MLVHHFAYTGVTKKRVVISLRDDDIVARLIFGDALISPILRDGRKLHAKLSETSTSSEVTCNCTGVRATGRKKIGRGSNVCWQDSGKQSTSGGADESAIAGWGRNGMRYQCQWGGKQEITR